MGRPVRRRPQQVQRAQAHHRGHAWYEGGDSSGPHQIPGKTKYDPITLEAGVTHDTTFEDWANKVNNFQGDAAMSLATLPQGHHHRGLQPPGQKVLAYNVFRCWVSEYQALPQLDASAQRGDDQHHQAGERGLGARHVGRGAEGDVGRADGNVRGRPAGRLLGRRRAAAPRLRARGRSPAARRSCWPQAGAAARGQAGHRGAQPLRAPARRHQPGADRGRAAAAGRRPAVPAAAAAPGDLRRPGPRASCSARGRTAASACRIDFAMSDVPCRVGRQPAPLYTMTLSAAATTARRSQVTFRLPDGADQEELSASAGKQRGGGADRCCWRAASSGSGRRIAGRGRDRGLPAGARRDRGAHAAAGARGRADDGHRLRRVRPHRSLCRSTCSGSSSASCAPTATCSTARCTTSPTTTTGASTRSWR